jgi:hypothetical protein
VTPAHSSAAAPATIMGRWLLAALLGEREERDRLARLINPGGTGWTDDESAVVEAVCTIAVGQYLGADYDVREVRALAGIIPQGTGQNVAGDVMGIEAVIRAALGENNVDLTGIGRNDRTAVHFYATMIAVHKLGLDNRAVTRLVVEAENDAMLLGWNPPSAGP